MGVVAADTIQRALCRAALALPLAACSSSPNTTTGDNIAIVAGAATSVVRATPAVARPTPLPTVTPVPRSTSFADTHPHKSFTDPPLPPELRAHVPPATTNGASSSR